MFQRLKVILKDLFQSEVPSSLSRLDHKEIELISRIRSNNLTYLTEKKLASIADTCKAIVQSGLPGTFIEAGCALGGSAINDIILIRNNIHPSQGSSTCLKRKCRHCQT